MSFKPACSICCEKYTISCDLRVTECGHIFHEECIFRWTSRQLTCPECGQLKQNLFNVYLNFINFEDEEDMPEQEVPTTLLQEIENLRLQLLIRKQKLQITKKRLQECEEKQRKLMEKAKEKEEWHKNLLKLYQDRAKKGDSSFRKGVGQGILRFTLFTYFLLFLLFLVVYIM